MKYYTIGEFADEIGVTVQALRNWDKTGRLKPSYILPSGHRRYSQEQLNHYLGLNPENKIKTKKTIGYCRVSTNSQKDDLERQVELMNAYLMAQGKPFDIIKDIGSGINYNNKGLNQLIKKVINYEVDKVVVTYEDRLLRMGYPLLENIFNEFGVKIEVINSQEESDEDELVKQVLQIMTVYVNKINGKRGGKARKILKDLKELDSN